MTQGPKKDEDRKRKRTDRGEVMPTPKHIRAFELRLRANWSSEDVVQMLTPDFVESVLLHGFAALEPTIKVSEGGACHLRPVGRLSLQPLGIASKRCQHTSLRSCY